MKTCGFCNETKPDEDFVTLEWRPLSQFCKFCRENVRNPWSFTHAKTPDHKRKRAAYNKEVNFGLTQEQHDELVAKQEGKCAVCTQPFESGFAQHAVDHCHTTGRIRGLLCHRCNLGLGHFSDDPDIMQRAVDYLRAADTGLVHKKFR